MEDDEDIRSVELSAIAAIYSEELKVDEQDAFTFTLEVPISLSKPLVVRFPTADEAAAPEAISAGPALDSQEVSNLPALQLRITIPEGYPHRKPPVVAISTSPPWLSERTIRKLEGDAARLWEEIGRDQVVFMYIDDVQQSADNVFGLVDANGALEVGPEHMIAILDYDVEAKRRAFQRGTFECGICLDPKKGSVCHRMLDCGHVFCVQCLQDFYNNAITEGDVSAVKCLEPKCAEDREKAAQEAAGGKRRKPKTFLNPSELLQIPLDQEMIRRYVTLKHKTELESDKNTIYCPRPWCQGAARSKKHKKPEGLEFAEDSEDDIDDDDKVGKKDDSRNLLAICEDCSFAFCTRCKQSWHGEFKYCMPKERKAAITEEEKASLEYLRLHTSQCPTCAAPCQKTHGCNHMRCFRCQTHFCYLCSAWLDPSNPYQHFNIQPDGKVNGCYMRLWELEGGDGDDVGLEFVGGDALDAHAEPARFGQHLEIVEEGGEQSDDEDEVVDAVELPALQQQQPRQDVQAADQPQQAERGRVAIAREGPLVLRIEGNAAAPRGEGRGPAPREPAPAAARGGPRGINGVRRRGGRGRAAQGQGQGQGQNPLRAPRGQNNRRHRAHPQGNRNGLAAEEAQNHDMLEEGQLNQVDEIWVRQFVQLALNDQEHLLEFGDEEEEDE